MGSLLYMVAFFLSAQFLFSTYHGSALPNLTSTTLSFDDGYTQLFGDSNLMLHRDGKAVHISLDERTGAGFASQDQYLHGFFSASIKLPSDYAAGVVVAFYMSNGDVFENTHDELDFEFLGNIRGKEWRVQTNVYGNGSTGTGREERYGFWFDPTEDFHQYSILWSNNRIVFYIDSTPIREIVRTPTKEGDFFPSKPMSLYATIWDGSNWATSGGRYKVNYKYAPFIAEFADLILHGCVVDPIDHTSTCETSNSDQYAASAILTTEQREAMANFRKQHMTYSYCYDHERYPMPLADCSSASTSESSSRLRWSSAGGRLGGHHRRVTDAVAVAVAVTDVVALVLGSIAEDVTVTNVVGSFGVTVVHIAEASTPPSLSAIISPLSIFRLNMNDVI